MSTLFQDEILKRSQYNESRSSTPFTYDSDCSGSGVELVKSDPPDHRPLFLQLTSLTAESLIEWQWPPVNGEWFLLQEQIKDFLHTRNFHRRYPDIHRHSLSPEERNHLIDVGLLREPAFHFIAVQTVEVLDILKEDFPTKYSQLLSALQKKDVMRHAQLVALDADEADEETSSEKVSTELRDVLVEDALSFNKRLCRDRARKYTAADQSVYLPRNTQYIAPKSATKRGQYPVALLPGQYTDSVPQYTSEELFTLPLNTALMHNEAEQKEQSPPQPMVVRCGICTKPLAGKEPTIKCNACQYQYHSLCMSISDTMLSVVSNYAWECPACKKCSVCDAADGDEHVMFCDVCDRGYHTFCVSLPAIPRGRWECSLCVQCKCCGATSPGERGWRFQHNKNMRFIQTMCHPCTVYFDKGWFCPVCLKVFDYDAEDNPMVCCDFCDRWIHTVCDNIDDEHYAMLGADGSKYKCVMCRGEKEEIYDIHHKKYKEVKSENKANVSREK